MEWYRNLSPDIWGEILTDWFTRCFYGYIVFMWYKFDHFSLPSAIHRMTNSPNILCSRCTEQDESHPHFIFHWKLSKTTLDFISGLINLDYTFNMPFKVRPKAKAIINGGFISKFHDDVHSKILPTLLEEFLRHFIKIDMTK